MAEKGKGLEGLGAHSNNWANLPQELLVLIAERLYAHSLIDFQRFCATCSSWRSFTRIIGRWGALHVPALIVPSEHKTKWYYTERFDADAGPFDLFCMYTVYLVQQKNGNQADISSNKWWLVQLRDKPYVRGKANKLHVELLSKAALGYNHNTIPKELNFLNPSISELCKYYTWQAFSGHMWIRVEETKRVQKIAFVFSRSVAGKYAAVGLYGTDGKLAFMKSSDEGIWISIDYYEASGYNDVIDYNGVFYAVHCTGKLFRIDLSAKVTEIASPILRGTEGIQKTLVKSAGDLLLLDKYIDASAINSFRSKKPSQSWFQVYKLNEEEETNKLVEIQTLGDRVLFLTGKYCFSVSAQHLPGCTTNCIYLTEQFDNAYHMDQYSRQQLSTGFPAVFNLEDGSYKRI